MGNSFTNIPELIAGAEDPDLKARLEATRATLVDSFQDSNGRFPFIYPSMAVRSARLPENHPYSTRNILILIGRAYLPEGLTIEQLDAEGFDVTRLREQIGLRKTRNNRAIADILEEQVRLFRRVLTIDSALSSALVESGVSSEFLDAALIFIERIRTSNFTPVELEEFYNRINDIVNTVNVHLDVAMDTDNTNAIFARTNANRVSRQLLINRVNSRRNAGFTDPVVFDELDDTPRPDFRFPTFSNPTLPDPDGNLINTNFR